MRYVGTKAFYECGALKNVQLNEGLEKLGAKEEVCDKLESEGEVFYGTAIESIRIPSTVKRVEAGTFKCCYYLINIEIPDGVEYIGRECFWDSGIEEITLPGTLKEIGEDAFEDCEKLKTVWVEEGC